MQIKFSKPIRIILIGSLVLACVACPVVWFVYTITTAFHSYELGEQLWEAAGNGHIAEVERLLAHGVSPDFEDAGSNVLEMAVSSGNLHTVTVF